MRRALTACLLPLTLLLSSMPSQALEVSLVKGYYANTDKTKAMDVVKVWAKCGSSYCGDTPAGKYGDIELVGRVRERSIHIKDDPLRVGPAIVAREYAEVAKRQGGKLINQADGSSGPFVYRFARADGGADWLVLKDNFDGYYTLVVVEEAQRENTVSITAQDMANALKSEGDVALYIEFETAKAEILPAGQGVVKEIVSLLRNDPQLKVSIEGHTDNTGNAAENQRLSQARAEAVMKAVIAQGIDAKRLKSAGHGAVYPIADNRKEAGRTKNRRVELVKV
ncbi:MAG TPA: OmpA family protein [Burkholderiaceae bacterium]|nr:OmpA family protein [Burkholderiaceae bacterium]